MIAKIKLSGNNIEELKMLIKHPESKGNTLIYPIKGMAVLELSLAKRYLKSNKRVFKYVQGVSLSCEYGKAVIVTD